MGIEYLKKIKEKELIKCFCKKNQATKLNWPELFIMGVKLWLKINTGVKERNESRIKWYFTSKDMFQFYSVELKSVFLDYLSCNQV